jgi:hypothetical protein
MADVAESVLLIWIKKGEDPESPGVNMDHTEHFSCLREAILAAAVTERHPRNKAPWIKTADKWLSPDEIQESTR